MSRRIHSPKPIIVAPKICRDKKEKTGGQRKREERKKKERINHIV